jgi:pimeloyl-ACP methyl ester carboxylesterase
MIYFICSLILIALLFMLAVLFVLLSKPVNNRWYNNPYPEGKFLKSHQKKLHYRVTGKNEPAIVIITSAGSSQAEWWIIQNSLQLKYKTITWDRSGYGRSDSKKTEPTNAQIADEIDQILKFERIKKPVFLVAHGTGTIYAKYYAATRPDKVTGCLFVNPVPVNYAHWLDLVKENDDFPTIFETIEKRKNLASRGYYRIFSPIRGYKFSRRYKRAIVEHYTRIENYETAHRELSELLNNTDEINSLKLPLSVPVKILYPADESLVREWIKNGISEYSARQLVRIYQELCMENMDFSLSSSNLEIAGTGEHIHLSKPDIIIREIENMIGKKDIKPKTYKKFRVKYKKAAY